MYKPHKQSLFTTHKYCNAVLVLNIYDGSVVNALSSRYLLKSEIKAIDMKWHVQTTQTNPFHHSQLIQCRVGTEYIRW